MFLLKIYPISSMKMLATIILILLPMLLIDYVVISGVNFGSPMKFVYTFGSPIVQQSDYHDFAEESLIVQHHAHYSAPILDPSDSIASASSGTYKRKTNLSADRWVTSQRPVYTATDKPLYTAPAHNQTLHGVPDPLQPVYAAPDPLQKIYAAPKSLYAASDLPLTLYTTQSAPQTLYTDPPCGYFVRKPPDGRLGSQMSAYASFYGMVRKQQANGANKTAFIRDSSKPFLRQFFANLTIEFHPVTDQWISGRNFTRKHENGCCRFNEHFMEKSKCDGTNVYINGYGNSYLYFRDYFKDIKREFEFGPEIREKAGEIINNSLKSAGISRDNCTLVGVHLRRGDFLDDHVYIYGHAPATVDYLNRAVDYFQQKINNSCLVFLIFGNDYNWNRKASQAVDLMREKPSRFLLMDSKKSNPGADMVALSRCDHVAISTGTFGWWSAFFNQGLVVYQKEYARPNSIHWKEYEPKEYFLPHWIGL